MKFLSILAAGLILICFTNCSKTGEKDKRDAFTGNYKNLTGDCKYAFDGFGYYWEFFSRDTASFLIRKASGSDSTEFIYLEYVGWVEQVNNSGTGHTTVSLKFVDDGREGVKVYGSMMGDTAFVIPFQMPFQGSGFSIDGSGSIKNGKKYLTYHTLYRGNHKYSTVFQ